MILGKLDTIVSDFVDAFTSRSHHHQICCCSLYVRYQNITEILVIANGDISLLTTFRHSSIDNSIVVCSVSIICNTSPHKYKYILAG